MFLAYRLSNLYLITLGHFHISPNYTPSLNPLPDDHILVAGLYLRYLTSWKMYKKSVTPFSALQLSELRGNAGDSAVAPCYSILKKITNPADPSIY